MGLVFMILMWDIVFIVFIAKCCPVNIDDARPNHLCDFIYGNCVYSCTVVIKGGQFAYMSVSW